METSKKTRKLCNTKYGKTILKVFLGITFVAILIVALYKIKYLKKHVEVIIVNDDQEIQEPEQLRHQKSRELSTPISPWDNIRLPKDVVPEKYNMSLDVDMEEEVYSGVVNIRVNVMNDTDIILLHQSGLTLNTVYVINENQQNEKIAFRRNEPTFEYHVIKMISKLQAGKTYNIIVSFSNTIRDDLGGFFISRRRNSKIAATFFSPINARTAFPCFDEPSFKATFTLAITSNIKYSALSNMEVALTSIQGSRRTTMFKKTLRMSTYIFAWVIHDDTYHYIKTTSSSGVVIKAWYFKDELNHLHLGINATRQLLDFYENFFDNKFPLIKLDITVQPYFVPSAMENWGLMTFRKNRYMFSSRDNSFTYIFGNSMIGHEMTHQWFGNLATMEYWNEAWLKEGFATYIGIYGVQKTDPSLPIGDMVYSLYMADALELDSYATSHSMTRTLKTNSEVREMFDTITYNKGSCMVQMLQKFLGEEKFKKGLQAFLKKYQYKNANQQGLWKVLGESSGKDVKTFMKEWTEEKGFPLLKVNRINDTHVNIEQEPFSLDPPNHVKSKASTMWQVLVMYRSLDASKSGSYVLKGKSDVFKIPKDSIINPNHAMYYRVKYGKKMAADLVQTLEHNTKQMNTLDRIGLISDQINIMAAQQASLSETMKYFKYLQLGLETHSKPWDEVVNHFMMVHEILEDTTAKSKLKDFLLHNYILPKRNRYEMQACKLNSSAFINSSNKDSKSRNLLCCLISIDSTHQMWDRTFKDYLNNRDTSLLAPLACTTDAKRIKRILNYTMNPVYVHPDSTTIVLGYMAKTYDLARDTTWEFIKSRWLDLMSRYNDDIFYLNELIYGVIPLFSTQQKLNDVRAFFIAQKLGTAKAAVQQTMSQINMKISYKKYMAIQINNIFLTKKVLK